MLRSEPSPKITIDCALRLTIRNLLNDGWLTKIWKMAAISNSAWRSVGAKHPTLMNGMLISATVAACATPTLCV
jgi:hypothetical protein